MENSLVSWWWYAVFSAIVLFLMSWQRAHGFFNAARLKEVSFAIAAPAWQIPVSGSECGGVLAAYWLDGTAPLTIEATPEATILRAAADQVRAGFALHLPCPAPVVLEVPISRVSFFEEKPWLTASVSGETRFSMANQPDRIVLYWPENTSLRLDAFLPSSGDELVLGSAHALGPADYANRTPSAETTWGETVFIRSDSPGINALVSSPMFTPTDPSHVKPVVGCGSRAALGYPVDFGASCWLVDVAELSVPKSGWRGRTLFATQPGGGYSPVVLPAAETPALPGEVVVSEIMWMGSFRGEIGLAYDEWVELANRTERRFNLRGLKIEGAAAAGGVVLVDVDLFLEPYGFVLIGRRGGANTELGRDPDWVTTYLSLNNDGAQITLRAPNGVELDQTPTGGWLAGVNDAGTHVRASAQRRRLDLSGSDWDNWGDCAGDLNLACLERAAYWRPGNRMNLGTPWQPNIL